MPKLDELESRVDQNERDIQRLKEAFVKNEWGLPDIDGHRAAHDKDIKRSKEIDGLKMDVTKWLVNSGLVALVGTIGLGIGQYLKRMIL